jgi:hypothetical protein
VVHFHFLCCEKQEVIFDISGTSSRLHPKDLLLQSEVFKRRVASNPEILDALEGRQSLRRDSERRQSEKSGISANSADGHARNQRFLSERLQDLRSEPNHNRTRSKSNGSNLTELFEIRNATKSSPPGLPHEATAAGGHSASRIRGWNSLSTPAAHVQFPTDMHQVVKAVQGMRSDLALASVEAQTEGHDMMRSWKKASLSHSILLLY